VPETWRDVPAWVGQQVPGRFGDAVTVTYYDLFDPTAPALPPEAQLPLVLANREVLSSGGKISVPAIRRRLETLGLVSSRPV
jgi:hypothetical protein